MDNSQPILETAVVLVKKITKALIKTGLQDQITPILYRWSRFTTVQSKKG